MCTMFDIHLRFEDDSCDTDADEQTCKVPDNDLDPSYPLESSVGFADIEMEGPSKVIWRRYTRVQSGI